MAAIKCPKCDFVNQEARAVCQRCREELPLYGFQGGPRPDRPKDSAGVWREKEYLVMLKTAALPDRCVKCNETVGNDEKIKMQFLYLAPALRFMGIMLGGLGVLLLNYFFAEKTNMLVGLCDTHKNTRQYKRIGGGLIAASSGGLLGWLAFSSWSMPMEPALFFPPLIALIGGLFLVGAGDPLSTNDASGPRLRLKGAGEAFLETLPIWKGH